MVLTVFIAALTHSIHKSKYLNGPTAGHLIECVHPEDLQSCRRTQHFLRMSYLHDSRSFRIQLFEEIHDRYV